MDFAELPRTPCFLNDSALCILFGKIADWADVSSLKWKSIALCVLSRYLYGLSDL